MSFSPFQSASELAGAIAAGHLRPSEVVDLYLERIQRYNPALNAIITLDADGARSQARAADEALQRGENWGPLHGVPITIKDNLETAGMRTTCGFKPLANYIPRRDASAVARLRRAGAIILGKTNLPALAMDSQTNNVLFGRTNNPWDLSHTVGGSSGGAAAALAAGLTALELGSDIGGSLRLPAHFCGIFSFMPTDHRVPWTGHIPPLPGRGFGLLRSLLTIGPLARSVPDLRLALSLIAGPDGLDLETPPVPLDNPPVPPLDKLRIAWTDDFGLAPVGSETRAAMANLADALRQAGCRVERCNPPDFDFELAVRLTMEIMMATTGVRSTPFHLPRFFFRVAAYSPLANSPAASGFLRGLSAAPKDLAEALVQRDRLTTALENFLSNWDAWLCPVAPGPAFPHIETLNIFQQAFARLEVDGRRYPYTAYMMSFAAPFNLTGGPVATLPLARSREGLPIGIQVVGRRWQDMQLLAVAQALSAVTGPFQPPPGYCDG